LNKKDFMNYSSAIFVVLCSVSSSVRAEFENIWIELGAAIQGASISLKAIDDDFNWALESAIYTEPMATSYQDRDTGKYINFSVVTLGVTHNWTSIGYWGYLDAGLGLGIGKGTWITDCGESRRKFFSTTTVCESSSGFRPDVLLHASAVFGKYFGIGITANAFITLDVAN
jgi:hypothetical protein